MEPIYMEPTYMEPTDMEPTDMEPTIQSTYNYGLFEYHPFNRSVEKIKRLELSMKKFGFDDGNAIRCVHSSTGNGKLVITQGHHRFEVARKLNLPLFYVVVKDTIPIFELEKATVPWKLTDWIKARYNAGDPAAAAVLDYQKRIHCPLSMALSLLSGVGACANGGNCDSKIKNGTYKLGDMTHAHDLADLLEFIDSVPDFPKYIRLHTPFMKSISRCLLTPCFDVNVFKKKLPTRVKFFKQCHSVPDYLELLQEFYNHGLKESNKIPLKFESNKHSKMRIPDNFTKNKEGEEVRSVITKRQETLFPDLK